MRDMKSMCEYLKIEVTEDQSVAGRYLESRGAKFLVDFGYENAVAKADVLFDKECDEALAAGLLN